MVQPDYDVLAIKHLMHSAFAVAERGQKAEIARRLEVTPPTVTKWAQGQICPGPEHWAVIEDVLSTLNSGQIARVGKYRAIEVPSLGDQGAVGDGPSFSAEDRALLHQLAERVDMLERWADSVSPEPEPEDRRDRLRAVHDDERAYGRVTAEADDKRYDSAAARSGEDAEDHEVDLDDTGKRPGVGLTPADDGDHLED